MRITHRDHAMFSDLIYSHAWYRDQAIGLGYFNSVTRANSRFRELCKEGFLRRLETPFLRQSIFVATKRAAALMDGKIARLFGGRLSSPQFLRHCLTVTDVRIALLRRTAGQWRFEQELWRKLPSHGIEVRPDGLVTASTPIFVEIDLGHASPKRFKEKLQGYSLLAHSGLCRDLYGFDNFRLLTVTTGALRARHLRHLLPQDSGFGHLVQTFEDLGVTLINSWS